MRNDKDEGAESRTETKKCFVGRRERKRESRGGIATTTHLERRVLVEIRERGVAQNLGAPVVLARSVHDVAVLEFDETVLVLLVAQGDEFVEHERVAAHVCGVAGGGAK
jgi:hypothetical protein